MSKPTKLQIAIDRMRFVLGVVAIIAIAVTFTIGRNENARQNARIQKIESPCLRYGPKSKECHKAFGAAIKSITPYQLCILLSRQPTLTGVRPGACERIAREATNRRESGQSTPGSHGVSSPAPVAGTRPTAPAGTPGSGNHPQHPGGRQTPKLPAPKGSSPTPGPESQPQPTSPHSPPVGATNPPPASAQEPPLVELEVPSLPAHVCAPGVVRVNC